MRRPLARPPSKGRPPRARTPEVAIAVALVLILGATLVPLDPARTHRFTLCLLCGARGTADALLNVLLFAPLGAALALSGRAGYRPVVYAALLSLSIELTQFAIPGRDPSLGDVCFNTLGAAVGQLLYRLGAAWWRPPERTAARLSLGASIVLLLAVTLSAVLLRPALPSSSYYTQVRSARDASRTGSGFVVRADLADEPLPSRDGGGSRRARSLLLAGGRLRLDVRSGPAGVGSGRLLSIRDERRREIVFLGVAHDDLLMRFYTLGAAWGFDPLNLRLRRALPALTPGDSLHIEARRERSGACFSVNGAGDCASAPTIGSGWTLLLSSEGAPHWLQIVLNLAWTAALVLPVGLWSRRHAESGVGLLIVLGTLGVLPGPLGLRPTPALQWLAAAAGLALGLVLQGWPRQARQPPIILRPRR